MRRAVSEVMLIVLFLSVLISVVKIQPVKAATITVPDDYPTIQEAVDAAVSGDTVYVRNGTYHEELNVDKSIAFVGEDKSTKLVGNGTSIGFSLPHEDILVKIIGFTIENYSIGVRSTGHGADGRSRFEAFENLFIENGIGACVDELGSGLIADSVFFNNTNSIYAGFRTDAEIRDNLLLFSDGYGIAVDTNDGYTNVTNNYLRGNRFGVHILSAAGYQCSGALYNTTLDQNDYAVYISGRNSSEEPSNILWDVYNNNFVNNTQQVQIEGVEGLILNVSWNAAYPSGGNYWSDYTGSDLHHGSFQNETGSDGIGDVPYAIDANNRDNYPLMNPWAPPDIAVNALSTSKTIVGQGYFGNFNVTFENQGSKIEAFNFTTYANSTAICSEQIMLTASNFTLSFIWNTTGFAYGNYTINACAEPLLEESDLSDNNCTCSFAVHIGVPGDISGVTVGVYDGQTNMRDIQYMIGKFNSKPGYLNWVPNADVNNDNVINMRDIQIAILNFNQHE
ncbi:MAG TPA: NosD domain-containing protein [Candidatus Bathyarchaeia archaeon]|nr:NosD domain-containing protein [Candidatus Bathyarchaeia archaeon]